MKAVVGRKEIIYIALGAIAALAVVLALALACRCPSMERGYGGGVAVTTCGNKAALIDNKPTGVAPPESGEYDGRLIYDADGIVITRVIGKTHRGYMAAISDPLRVFVGTPYGFNEDAGGMTVPQLIARYDAALGINGAGFLDLKGVGTGGTPLGLVMQGGRLVWDSPGGIHSAVGFDGEGLLHVGSMTSRDAKDAGLCEAVAFGPSLIIDGVVQDFTDLATNDINPRTAIGQREDGTVVCLMLEGRQISSLGATLDTLAELMFMAGCVNASNLDGGASSSMVCEAAGLYAYGGALGPRRCATGFLVRAGEEEGK